MKKITHENNSKNRVAGTIGAVKIKNRVAGTIGAVKVEKK